MEKIRVLITDDSVVYRSQIRAALQDLPQVEVVGAASHGRIAIEKISHGHVDLLILDLEMPEMDGIQTLTELKSRSLNCKTLVFSSVSKRGAEITMEALRLGASDFVTKPDASQLSTSATNPTQKIKNLLLPRIQGLFPDSFSGSVTSGLNTAETFPHIIWDLFKPEIIVIGCSTGGPTVLEKIFSQVQAPINCPIVIVQHMPPLFTATLAERIFKLSGITAQEAVHGSQLEKNRIYIAPGDFHLRLHGTSANVTLLLDQDPQINSVRPAVDPLFESAAAIFKNKCLGFILTGMGADGKVGAVQVKKNGGAMVIQDKASCVVFGMPGVVQACGAYDKIATPDQIIQIIKDKATTPNLTLKNTETGS